MKVFSKERHKKIFLLQTMEPKVLFLKKDFNDRKESDKRFEKAVKQFEPGTIEKEKAEKAVEKLNIILPMTRGPECNERAF
ncbi:unnamed protein product [Caenorhabditis brenneri]